MTGFRWNSLQELTAIQEKMNRLFEEALDRREFPERARGAPVVGWCPAADAYESPEEYVFRVEIPGVTLSDVKLEVDGSRLRVFGTRPEAGPAARFLRMERVYGEFSREFEIPRTIDREHISASLDSGILTIVAPKTGGTARRRGSTP